MGGVRRLDQRLISVLCFEQGTEGANEDSATQAEGQRPAELRPSPRAIYGVSDSLHSKARGLTAVLEMSAVDFAALIVGGRGLRRPRPRRNRRSARGISEAEELAWGRLSAFGNHKDGLSRTDIAGHLARTCWQPSV